MIDRPLSELGEEFFRLCEVPAGTVYKNLCYWVGFAKPAFANGQPNLSKVKAAMSLQYSREGQVWREEDSCIGDPRFCGENVDLFAPVQCVGRYSPFRDLSTLFPEPCRVVADAQMKPMALAMWSGCSFDPTTAALIAARGGRQERLVALINILREQADRPFFFFAIPGWSQESVEINFAAETRRILSEKGGFRFVDRGPLN